MRIALIHPYFTPEVGYESIVWYRTFLGMGHRVRAFCSAHVPTALRKLYDKPFRVGLTELEGGEVCRLPARLLPRNLIVCQGLVSAVRDFGPDLSLLIGATTLFGSTLLKDRRPDSGLVFCSFGENRAQRRTGLSRPVQMLRSAVFDVAFFLLKRRLARKMMEASDATLLNTPDAFDFLLPRVATARKREELKSKCGLFPLGFDPSLFYVDPGARSVVRQRLGISDDEVVGLYSCKATPEKRVNIWVSVMAAAMRQVPRLRAVLVGVREDDTESKRILRAIEKTGIKDRFTCLPFAARDELPRLYNAADFGVWYLQPSITIQEAMGTGLYMVLTNDATVSHLVLDPETGRYFEQGNYRQLEKLVVETAGAFLERQAVSRPEARKRRAEVNALRFGYGALAERVVRAAEDPTHAVEHLHFEADLGSELFR